MKEIQAKMFNRRAANPKNKPDQILEALGLQLKQNVADIGAGGGYFSLRFASTVGKEGHVYAVDTNPDFLEFIESNAHKEGLGNVTTILAEDKLALPESLDLVFMRNVCHHIPDRVKYFSDLKSALKPEGRVAIIEYRPGGVFSSRRIFGHYIPQEIIIKELEQAGYRLDKTFDFLSEQSFTIFFSE